MERKHWLLIVSLGILMLLLFSFLNAEVIPTNEWVNFFSSSTTFDGSPVPVGAVIEAYDPDGVLCGTFTVNIKGQYGFLVVYKDDFTTTDIDEGAEPGDTITFYINGHIALPQGPTTPVWTSNGDIINVDLEGHSNYDPVITSTPDTTATEDELYSYTVTATDIDEDNLTYSLIIQPGWLSINSATGIISGTPNNNNVGDTLVSVKVVDGHDGEDIQTYTLHVSNTNDPPVITTTSLSNAIEDVIYSETMEAYDVDAGDVITFSLIIYPSWLSINGSTGILSGTPTNDDIGTNIQVKVMVSDLSEASDTLDTFIDVININDPPVISGFPHSLTFRSDTTHSINLNNYVNDVDNENLGLNWTVSGNDSIVVSINPVSNIAELSASLTFSGIETLIFTVSDDSMDSDSDTVLVQVIPYIYPVDISLNEGWNLISWDVDSPNDSLEVLLDNYLVDIEIVIGFENEGLTYDPDLPQFSNLLFMDHLHGYWVKTKLLTTLDITGSTVSDTASIFLEKGWNLVSYLPDKSDSIYHALGNIFENVIVVMGYNEGGLSCYPPYPEYNNLQVMSHNYGYWIKMLSADTLIYPDTQVGVGKSMAKGTMNFSHKTAVIPTNEWINIFGENVNYENNRLKIGSIIQAKDPTGVTCGEYVMKREDYFGMMPVYRDDPRTEVDEGAKPGDVITIYVNGLELEESVVWKSFGDVHRISLHPIKNIIPDSYNLSQNFPNPFNPNTNIQYQLPVANHVSLVIYNALGERIRTLVNEEKDKGYYSVSWDGKNDKYKAVSSGIYFYQIKAGDYTKTQKMVFLR